MQVLLDSHWITKSSRYARLRLLKQEQLSSILLKGLAMDWLVDLVVEDVVAEGLLLEGSDLYILDADEL
jgi:hypothetical protein